MTASRRTPVSPPHRRPRPPTSAAWTPSSPRPRRRASSTSSRCRRTGPTTARSSRRSRPSTASRSTRRSPTPPARTRSTRPTSSRASRPRPDVFDLGSPSRWPTPRCSRRTRSRRGTDIPDELKDPNGTWVNDYGGYMSIGYDSAKVPDIDLGRRPAQARLQGQGRAQRRPDRRPAPRSTACMMAAVANGGSADDIAPGVDFFTQAQAGRQLPAGRPDPGDHRVRPDAGRHRLGLPQRRRRPSQAADAGRCSCPPRRGRRRLLLPGDQQGRPAPGRRPAVAGVPLLRRGPEPVPQGRRPSGARRRDGQGRHDRRRRLREAAAGRAARR